MKLIVGLGNPGEKYEPTRHNVGFEIIDLFRQELPIKNNEHYQHFSLVTKCQLDTEPLMLVKPQTFMNSSGKAVSALASYYDIPSENIYVIYDDLNLDFGLLRVRRGGSAGGHNGVKSIIESLGNQSFPRLRIGIGQPPQNMDAIDYVLGKFSPNEREEFEQIKPMAVDALKIMILDGIDSAMNKYNSRQINKDIQKID